MKALYPVLTWILISSGTVLAVQIPHVAPPKQNPSPSSQKLRSQLRQSQLSPVDTGVGTSESQKSLQDLTEELRRLQLPQLQTSDAVASKPGSPKSTVDTPLLPSPASPDASVATSKQSTPANFPKPSDSPTSSGSALPKAGSSKPVTADAVITALAANPQVAVDLFSAAEALFAKRDLSRAAMIYKQVISQMTDNLQVQNQSWALFQYGNCLRFSKSLEAAALYDKVIAEYPESDWAKVARVRNQYISWAQQAKPETILIRYGYDPNSF